MVESAVPRLPRPGYYQTARSPVIFLRVNMVFVVVALAASAMGPLAPSP